MGPIGKPPFDPGRIESGDIEGAHIGIPAEVQEVYKVLEGWWMDTAREDLMVTGPKAVEYGSQDLVELGRTMASMLHLEAGSETDFVELGCLFYVYGKIQRSIGAWRDGRRPSNDTYHDLTVYTMMIRCARERGGWPGA